MPTPDHRTRRCLAKRFLFIPIGLLCLATGCQSSKLAHVPGMGWLGSDQQPPVLETDQGLATYPPPSAAATPTALGEAKAAAKSAAKSANASGSSAYANKNYPTTGLATAGPPGAAVPQTRPAYTGSSGTVAAASTTAVNDRPIGLPPGVTAPNLSTKSPDVQSVPYAVVDTPPSAAPTSVASKSGGGYSAQSSYPMPNSGTATTWDNPNLSNNSVANASGGDFEPNPSTFAAATASGTSNAAQPQIAQPIPTSIPQSSTIPQNSNAAQASHYESIAQQQTGTRSGPWRPGSTTQYEPQSTATAANTAPYQVQPIPTAELPVGGSGTRASGWE